MAIEQTTSGTRLESIGTVKTIVGTVKAVDSSGAERILQAGDRVFANETIVTADGGMVLIEFMNGQTMDLASNTIMLLDASVFDPASADARSNAPTAEQIQEMIARGEDPTLVTEASAAGAGAGDEGSSSFVAVDPQNAKGHVESGFESEGLQRSEIQPPEQLFIANETGADPTATPEVAALPIADREDGSPTISIESVYTLTLINHEGMAGFNNSFGYYIKDAEGNPTTGMVVWDNVKNFTESTLNLTGITPDQVGFFLIPNGDVQNPLLEPNTHVEFRMVEGQWQVFASDTGLVGTSANVLFDVAFLNGDELAHARDNAQDTGNLNWEDRGGGGDRDYNDVNITATWNLLATQDAEAGGNQPDVDQASFASQFAIDADYGSDGAGALQVDYSLAIGEGKFQTGLTSGDVPITLVQNDQGVIMGMAGDSLVFTVGVDAAGNVILAQYAAIDHSADSDSIELPTGTIQLTATATIRDADNDIAKDSDTRDISHSIRFDDDVPVAFDDASEVSEDTASISGNVLSNDLSGGDASSIFVNWTSETAQYGTIVLNDDGSYAYTPNTHALQSLAEGETRTETFTYTLSDADGDEKTATLVITITGTNDAPVAIATSSKGEEDSEGIAVTLSGQDVDGTVSSFVIGDLSTLDGTLYFEGEVVESGQEILALNGSAELTFIPDADISNNSSSADFSFIYQARDDQGSLSDAATATLSVAPVTDIPVVTLAIAPVAFRADATDADAPLGMTITAYKNGIETEVSLRSSGEPTGFGVAGATSGNNGNSAEIARDESIEVTFDSPAAAVSFQVSWLRSNESARYTVSYSDGTSKTVYFMGSSEIGGNDGVGAVATEKAPEGLVITGIAFTTGSNISDDFLVHQVTYEAANLYEVSITAAPADIDHSETITALTITLNEGIVLSGAHLEATENGISTWTLPLDAANPMYTVTVNPVTGEVMVDGLTLSIPNSFSGELVLTAIATANDPDASPATGQATWSKTVNEINFAPEVSVTGVKDLVEGEVAPGDVVFTYTASDPESDVLATELINNSNGYLVFGEEPGTIVLSQAGADAVNANVPIEELTATVSIRESETLGHLVDEDSASVRVLAVNDAPETNAVAASGENNTAIELSLVGSDVDGSVDHFVIASLPANGTLFYNGVQLALNDTVPANANAATLTFVSTAGFDGEVSFQYHAVDNQGLVDPTPATATLVIDAADVPDVSIELGQMVNFKEINSTNASTTDQGFNIKVYNLDGSEGTLGVKNTWNDKIFGIKGGNSSGVDYEIGQNQKTGAAFQTEKLTVTFDQPVYINAIQFAWMSTIEHSQYVLKDVNGNVLLSNTLSGITDRIDPTVQVGVHGVASIEFTAPGMNDDYVLSKIYFTEDATYPLDITVSPVDTDHSESVVSVKVSIPEGGLLSGGSYVETINGEDIWDLPVNGGSGYAVTIDDATGAVSISGLKLTVSGDVASEGFTVHATATVQDAGGSLASGTDSTHYAGDNNVIANAGDDRVYGGDGNDNISGGLGNDILDGGSGNDSLYGGSGNDILTGGLGSDIFGWKFADGGTASTPAADVVTDFNASEGDTLNLGDMLTAGQGLTMSAVEAEGGHLQLQFTNSNSEVVHTIDITNVQVSGLSASDVMNQLLADGNIVKD